MKALLLIATILGTAGSAAALASEITFFENDNFGGRRFNASGSVSNLGNTSFNDRASSVAIRGSAWQLCADVFFRGRCVTLNPGDYPSLGAMGLNDRVSSAREVGWSAGGGGGGSGGSGGSRVTLYDYINFGGVEMPVDGPIVNLDGRFNDRAQSMVVHSGTWELCADASFSGGCQTYPPGRYASLGALSSRLSSLRPVGGGGAGAGAGWGGSGNWGSGNRTVLYEGANLSGRSFVVNEYMPNLDSAGFNDRASSLRVESGYWIFCSDANFRGECRTFGPGDYPLLPQGLNNRISSGRRISNDYPYNSNPAWN